MGAPGPEDPFEALWRHREEVVYTSLFGPSDGGIHALSDGPFLSLGATAIDPRWLCHGIIAFPPTPSRPTTLYVSSGLSLPWDLMEPEEWEADQPSGLGYELVVEVGEPSDWALDLAVHMLAYALLIGTGVIQAPEPWLRDGARVSFGGPLSGEPESLVRHVMTVTPPALAPGFATAAGTVELLQVIGLTDAEIAHARRYGPPSVLPLLATAGAMPTIDPSRGDVPGVLLLQPGG